MPRGTPWASLRSPLQSTSTSPRPSQSWPGWLSNETAWRGCGDPTKVTKFGHIWYLIFENTACNNDGLKRNFLSGLPPSHILDQGFFHSSNQQKKQIFPKRATNEIFTVDTTPLSSILHCVNCNFLQKSLLQLTQEGEIERALQHDLTNLEWSTIPQRKDRKM